VRADRDVVRLLQNTEGLPEALEDGVALLQRCVMLTLCTTS